MDSVILEYEDDRYKSVISEEVTSSWIDNVFKELKLKDKSCSISFVTPSTIKDLNSQYLGRDYATDVLSFSQVEGEGFGIESDFLGDIVVSVEFAEDHSEKVGHSTESEVKYLILHGVLHLLGFDHTENEDGIMSKLEKDIFKSITGEIIE